MLKKFILPFNLMLTMMATATLLSSCGSGTDGSESKEEKPNYENKLVQFSVSDPSQLNPYNGSGEQTTNINHKTHQALIQTNFKTYDYDPVLAVKRPVITITDQGGMVMEMEIRPEANWDNGSPITAEDVAFSLKAIKNPTTDCFRAKPYFEFITDVIIDQKDPKKFKLICDKVYHASEGALSSLWILPAYVYDPTGLMSEFTVSEMSSSKDFSGNEKMIAFGDFFNSVKFQREVSIGSGPYEFTSWETDARITFSKKKDWWGASLEKEGIFFEVGPDEIVYETIKDKSTAVTTLKDEGLDIMAQIPKRDFVEDLQKNKKFMSKYNLYSPAGFSYDYIGINMKDPRFSDLKVRQALVHIMDVDKIIETLGFGLGERIVSFIHPDKKIYYNSDLEPYQLDLEKAKKLLAEAGWADTNGDGTLDKEINGVQTEFVINLFYNTGNDRRKNICIFFQDGARKAGIKVNVFNLEFSVVIERVKKHDFELFCGGWVASPEESDPKQTWHTDSYNGGSNFVGFGNDESNEVIEKIRSTINQGERAKYYKELQKIIHEEIPYIFIMAPKRTIAIHKKWGNTYGSGVRPGYWESAMRLQQ